MIKQIHKLLLFITATFFAANVHAVELDGIYYYLNTTDKTACVTSNGDWAHPLSKYTGNITIPETITYNGSIYSVTSISNGAFYYCKNMISIDIPVSVTKIGTWAFQGCSGLTSINIPPSVTSIEYETFSYCSGLTSINIPSSVTNIGTYAFSGCSGLTSISIPSSVTNIGSSAFAGCSGLTTINIPSSVTNIGSEAFAYCSGLTSIDIPSSVTSIGSEAFYWCSKLTSINVSIDNPMYKSINGVLYNKDQTILLAYPAGKIGSFTIPSSVTSIESRAFQGCSGLTSINIPSSVTKIESSMFYGCSGLTSISIPSSVTSIDSNAFSGCSKLTSIDVSPGNSMYNSTNGVLYNKDQTILLVYPAGKIGSFTIPSSVTSIESNAFQDCSGLTTINIPSSVTSIEYGTFSGCSGLTSVSIPSSVTSIGQRAFEDCSGLTSISIPSSVTSIGSNAFAGCSGLTSISIPPSVTSIGFSAFSGCSGLASIDVSPDNSMYNSTNGVLYNKDQTILLVYPAGKIGSFTIPSSVTSIESNAFQDCSGLTTINIPSSVTSIGSETFSGCSELTSISIPSSVTSIGSKAFSGCSGLTSISIPSSVTSIGSETFSGCSGLTSISIPSSVTSIGYSAFSGCSGLTSISIPSSVTSIGYSAFEGCTLCPLLLSTKLRRDNEPRQIYSCLIGLNASSVVFAYSSEINLIQLIWDGTVGDIERPYVIHTPKNYLRSISFNIIANNLIPASLLNVKIGNNKTPYKEIAPDENGLYSITGLEINTSYYIEITYKFENGATNSITQEIKTLDPKLSQYVSTTQTTATININASSDESCSPTIRYDFNGKSYNCTENKIVFSDLIPGKNYPITIYADYNGKTLQNNTSFTTESLKPTITLQESSPTSISVKGSYTVKDAHVTETGFEGYDTDNTLTLTGLKPSTPYTINYYVKTEEGSNEIASQTFTTSDLELTTLQPRCVSSSCAIVAATTNISEEEMNVGFQWKKYDAPSSLKPNEGYAAIYGGQLEGYIRNLQSTSYYNVRAFYKSAEGDYFYGDWITFDPSDFSYFEPTVHTYAAAEVTHNSARMKGYILAGTEAIEEQGFEYWSTSTSSASARRVKAATTASDNVQTVFATGQVMTAELRDLLPATTYCCRAFVKTSSGITYGEEQTFTTQGDPTGIGFVSPDAPTTPIVEGYYDLNGRKFETPQRGINIIRYSNGTTRKIVVR